MDVRSKQPAEVWELPFDWSDRLVEGESVTSQSATVDDGSSPAGSLVVDSVLGDGSAVQVWLSGGTDGVDYRVTCDVQTDGGRRYLHTVIVQVRDVADDEVEAA